ncbi:hypothetical protein SAMN05443549_1011102 [Flavobacterium fluvii]|uniref:Uncharacterized protein n=1 Tax=Flavobacterium fluvii TaxID=468056 RepID=A0A1M5G5G7_9FLAO|nr:hypothetical protein [Flavobacterium fluvii]SHF98973.1 hypothetical protein SAMN05443549_1011102 [Flavobacterium fluvii]
MEQHKIEKQFREQLNSREIKPSEMAWAKLDGMLSEAEKPKVKFPWLYIAASFVGFVLIATFYFAQKEDRIDNQKNGVVIQNPVAPKTDAIPLEKVDFKIEEKGSVVDVSQQSAAKKDKSSLPEKHSLSGKNNLNQSQVAELTISGQKNDPFASSDINDKSIDEILAAVKTTSKPTSSKTTVKVNSNALLSQVDGELELSFREKVIDKVNENYQVVKEALASRNQE